jgi:hypothetical protein
MPRPSIGEIPLSGAERQACPCEGGGALSRGAAERCAGRPHTPPG